MSTDHTANAKGRNAKLGQAAGSKQTRKRPRTKPVKKSKADQKRPAPSANDLMLEAWEYTYATRDRRLD